MHNGGLLSALAFGVVVPNEGTIIEFLIALFIADFFSLLVIKSFYLPGKMEATADSCVIRPDTSYGQAARRWASHR